MSRKLDTRTLQSGGSYTPNYTIVLDDRLVGRYYCQICTLRRAHRWIVPSGGFAGSLSCPPHCHLLSWLHPLGGAWAQTLLYLFTPLTSHSFWGNCGPWCLKETTHWGHHFVIIKEHCPPPSGRAWRSRLHGFFFARRRPNFCHEGRSLE